ncbi:hypothetical protein Lal_00024304 [Lupinus albus]|uniref:Uncharacterized protein n=1 Tax=Lupinus albus TaxID=3870 RepID=A0A6A4N7D5_LUPAL|nr:hypothetical protein Lalb_Chr25g0282601 [Lupinus albus]KAF1866300.1 hypothetical protein Lal_00024304 [Lupinus albus]
MILLVEKFAKLYSKLENRHPHYEELSSSSLNSFQSNVSKVMGQLVLDLKQGSEILSLSWIEGCFGLLSIIHKAFEKFVVDIDYPMNKWNAVSIEGYLKYRLTLLELFNSMSSSLSHLGHARVHLAHGLTLLEHSPSLATKHLKVIEPGGCFSTNFGEELHKEYDDKAKIFSRKEKAIHEAMKEMKGIRFWVCGVLLSGLYSDAKPCIELRKIAGGFDSSVLMTLDQKFGEHLEEKMPIMKEVKEINSVVENLFIASDEVRHDATKELKTQLHDFEKILDDISKKVDDLFANVITHRSELIDCF